MLSEKDIPTHFLNINYYFNKYLKKMPEPPLHPGTKKPAGPQDLSPIFPMSIIEQEVSMEEKIEIPDEVRELYRLYRPSPLMRAKRLEKALQTPAHIYYKYEGVSPTGAHKLNSAIAQAYYNKKEGVKKLITETGAGQWGTALSVACNFFDLECEVFMVRISFEQKPYRKVIMNLFGAKAHASPSNFTIFGKKVLDADPNTPGSLGIAISEALEQIMKEKNAKYALGSVLNHVLLHQTIIGQEAIKQMQMAGESPDIVIGCCGGGSNFAGIAFPFLADELKKGERKIKYIGVEPASCPSLTKGEYRYDFGDTAQMTPLLKMKTLGSDFIPSQIHAGGLRYHGMAPLVSFMHEEKLMSARAYEQKEIFTAGIQFAKAKGIIPAPESSHAIKAAIDEAIACREQGKQKTILFNLSGHGLLDLKGYEDFLNGKI